ncbi:MAG: hypothetical protein H6737_11470 [Alphaproteobacteria bacterium]|nr:hypothetical protein [Alphaproteobacteria bacterium]
MREPIGRDEAIARLADAVSRPGRVQLVGPPGVGKTALVAWVARDRRAVWVDLEPVGDGALDAAVARSLDLPVDRAAIVGGLGEADLLVLDATEALGTGVSDWLDAVMPDCSGLAVVVTSRVRLPGFTLLEVGPLSADAAEALFRAEAEEVSAGVDLASEADAIRELVGRLDGLPLAITLAAGRLRLYSPTEMLAEEPLEVLSDRRSRGRHTSLEAALEGSWALLDPDARQALARIAQVRRWFGRSAFQEITGAGLEVLEHLLDASLVHWVASGEGRRYHLLEPIRRFALSRLPADDPARLRYVEGVLGRSESLARGLQSSEGREALARMRDLAPDLEGVLVLGGEAAARALVALARLAIAQGGMAEVVELVRGVDRSAMSDAVVRRLTLVEADLLIRLRRTAESRALWGLLEGEPEVDVFRGITAMREGHQDDSVALLERARDRALAREPSALGVPWDERVVEIHVALAATHMERGSYDQAIAVCEAGVAAAAHLDRPDLEGLLLRCQATASRLVSHSAIVGAIDRLERALERFRRIGSPRFEARTLTSLAVLESDLGRPSASARLDEAIPMLRRLGERFSMQRMQVLSGLIELDRGDLDRAEALFDGLRLESPKNRATLDCYRGVLFLLRGDTPGGLRALEEGVSIFASMGMQADAELAAHYLAVARAEPPPPTDTSRTETVRLAHRIAHARAAGRPLDDDVVEASRRDLDLRLLVRLTRLAGAAEVASDGSWFRTDTGRVELGRKRVLKRVLEVFARHEGEALTTDAVLAAAWPGERTAGNSGRARVHVAVSELRKLGLRDALQTATVDGGSGYLLQARILS